MLADGFVVEMAVWTSVIVTASNLILDIKSGLSPGSLSRRVKTFRSGRIAASLHTSRMSDPEYLQ